MIRTKDKSDGDPIVISKVLTKFQKANKVSSSRKNSEQAVSIGVPWHGRMLQRLNGIWVQLLIVILIPILCLSVFGVISYQKSSEAIIENYEKSTMDTLNAISSYMALGLNSVAGKSLEFMSSDSVTAYYNRGEAGLSTSPEEIKLLQPLGEDIMVTQGANSFIRAVHVFGKTGVGVTTESSPPADIYSTFLGSVEGNAILETDERYQWIGTHSFIDKNFNVKQEDYSVSIIRKMPYNNGYVIMDVSKEEILKMITQFNYGEGSILGFITGDGRETLTTEGDKSIFTELPYYQAAVSGNEVSKYSYETFRDKEYLFLFNKIGETGAMVCILIPKSTITAQAKSIRNLSFYFSVGASALALLAGTLIAGGIAGAIKDLIKSISLTAKGDLTTKFTTRRRDEFKNLSTGLTDMVSSMRKLIFNVAEVGSKVNESAQIVSETSDTILKDTRDISFTIEEIEKGVVSQAADTEIGLSQMNSLSEQINQVFESTYQIEQIANETKGIVGNGIISVDNLSEKAKATADITDTVIKEIEALEQQSHRIENFVKVINEIAAQTNLLSLNASIEAARAGEAGLGFAVVASEIHKLAEQSMNAVKEIHQLVTEIRNKTKNTVTSARRAEGIVQSQTEALEDTVQAFREINRYVINLINNLDNISNGVKHIETSKEDTMEAIGNISAVAQQTAAASEEVGATVSNQVGTVEYLSKSAIELKENARRLADAIQIFQIS